MDHKTLIEQARSESDRLNALYVETDTQRLNPRSQEALDEVVSELLKLTTRLATRLCTLEAGLAWYADEKHYDAYGAEVSPADQDAGAIARAALAVEG